MCTRPRSLVESLEQRQLLAAATISWTDLRQSIDGFGASTAWMWDTMSQTVLDQLYSTSSGAGLSLLRSHIYPQGWSSENGVMQQVAPYGVTVWSTPWSPPREWKTNHDNNNGGNLDPAHYQDYANLLADYVQDMGRQGVPLYAISLQNEPNWTADYESCRWDAQQFADFLPYVGQTFAARGITTKIMFPETLNWSSISSFAATVMSNPSLAQYVGILAGHNYGESTGSYQPVSNANGKPVWETEATLDAGSTQIVNAIDLGDDIHQALSDANASAYHYWWINASGNDQLMTNWVPNKRLWALGQYSRFVRPGWVRIGETDDGGLDITTFKDPASGKFAIVVVNAGASSITESFALSGFSAASVTPYITSSTDDLRQYSPITLTGGTGFTATIAANSIVTYYGISSVAPALQAPTNLRAAPVYGNLSSQIALSWTDNSSSESAYTIERSINGTTWTVLTSTLAANTTSYVDAGRAENTLYYYRVKPTNGGSATYSSVASASTILLAPSGIGTWGSNSSGFNLGWSANSAAATGEIVQRSTDGLIWAQIATLPAGQTYYGDTISGFNPNQIYYYRVRNTVGSSLSYYASWNSGLSVPASFAAAGTTSTSITFTWTNATAGASGAWIEQYNASNDSWSTVSPSSLRATDGTWTLTGLTGNTAYRFRLRVSSAADTVYSDYTAELNATTATPSVFPIAWYKADESSGTTLADASGRGNTATLSGSCSFTAGVSGNALTLSGGYAALQAGIASGLGDFTIATWVKASSLDNWARIFDFGTGTRNYMFLTAKAGDSGLPRFAITTGSGEQQINSGIAIPANIWTHIAVTLSGNTATLYINGAVAGTSTSMTIHPAALGTTTQNYLGKSQWADPNLQGSLDDFRIYERALSAAEVGTLVNPTLPAGWSHSDLGSPSLAGGASYSSATDTWTLSGSGADIWNNSDQFHYAYRSASDDFAIVARVTGITNTNYWAKAGIMVRDGIAANAAYAFLAMRPDNQAVFQWRDATGAWAQGVTMVGGTGIKYLKLERTAGMITGYYSTDGITWTAAAAATYVYMPNAVTAGLAVTSHDTTQLCTATFTNVQFLPAATVTNLTINGGSAQRSRVTTLAVTFSSRVTAGNGAFTLIRRSDNQSFTVLASNPSGDHMNYVLTFTGTGLESTSLPDGLYDVTVHGNLVHDSLGQTLSGGNYTYLLHRLFGDINGDHIVNSTDQSQFQLAQSTYNAAFDFNNDGSIGSTDAAAFNSRLYSGVVVPSLPPTFNWTSTGPLMSAPSDATHTGISIKDPSVVFYNNKWYVFASWVSTAGAYGMVYYSFSDWSQAGTATPFFLDTLPAFQGYKCAPEIFFMRPLNKWVLLFQGADPQYALLDDIDHPEQLTTPKSLFYNFPANSNNWIDFNIICDDTYAYLFFTKDNGEFYRSRTRLSDFPNGFTEPTLVMSKSSGDLFEAGHVYKLAGMNKYIAIIEAFGLWGRRYYTSYLADRLDGAWTPLGTSYDNPLASYADVTFPSGMWCDNFSHGELIRATYDETMTVDPAHLQLLYQGLDGSRIPSGTEYNMLPWQLGLLTIVNTAPSSVGFQVNDGSAQRSMVSSLTLSFDQPVILASDALSLSLRGGILACSTQVSNPSGDGKSFVLRFSGSGITGSSLPDGIYTLTVLAASVYDAYGQQLAGGNRSFMFHRLFGDVDGNKVVNASDYTAMRNTFDKHSTDTGFNDAFDYDNNLVINASDLTQFRKRFNVCYVY